MNFSDYVEVPIDAILLDVLNSTSVSMDWPVSIDTPSQPWAYAAYVAIPADLRSATNVFLRVRTSAVEGEPWIGALTRDERDFLARSIIAPMSESEGLLLGPLDLGAASKFVIENGQQRGGSRVTIQSASLLVPKSYPAVAPETASAKQPPARKQRLRRPNKKVRLGRSEFTICGLDEDDPYFAGLCENYELEFQGFCRRFLPSNAYCIDIGANIGVKSLFLSRHAHRGRIIAVEAAPSVFECLQANVTANEAHNVECVQAAVGDKIGMVHFSERSAYGHISDEGIEVPMVTLHEIVRRFDLPRVDFIKIDVEGFEFPILKSSYDLINHYRSLVLFEFNSWCQIAFSDVNPKRFLTWIFDHFQYVQVLNPGGKGGGLTTEFHKEQLLQALHDNLLRNGCVTDFIVTNEARRL